MENAFNAENIKETTLEYRYVSQTLWEQFIDFCFGNGPNSSSAGIVQPITVSLTAAQIKTGFSAPPVAIPAPGPGKAIQVLSVAQRSVKGGVAFTNTSFNILADTAPAIQWDGAYNNAAATSFTQCIPDQSSADQLVENKAVVIKYNADSLVGDGTAKFYFTYRIITF